MTTDQLCAAALKRLNERINRSAGQHIHAIRKQGSRRLITGDKRKNV